MAAVPMKMSPPGRRPGRLILMSAVGVAAVILLAGCAGASSHEVTVLRGETNAVNDTRTAIFFDGRRVAGPPGRHRRGRRLDRGRRQLVRRPQLAQPRHAGLPGAARPPGELGVLEAAATDDASGRGVVVWLRFLSRT